MKNLLVFFLGVILILTACNAEIEMNDELSAKNEGQTASILINAACVDSPVYRTAIDDRISEITSYHIIIVQNDEILFNKNLAIESFPYEIKNLPVGNVTFIVKAYANKILAASGNQSEYLKSGTNTITMRLIWNPEIDLEDDVKVIIDFEFVNEPLTKTELAKHVSGLWFAEPRDTSEMIAIQLNEDGTIYEYSLNGFGYSCAETKTITISGVIDFEEILYRYQNPNFNFVSSYFDKDIIYSNLLGCVSYSIDNNNADVLVLSTGLRLHRFKYSDLPQDVVPPPLGTERTSYPRDSSLNYVQSENIFIGLPDTVMPNVEVYVCISINDEDIRILGTGISEADGSFKIVMPPLNMSTLFISNNIFLVSAKEQEKERSYWTRFFVPLYFSLIYK